ncbi:hypothetical protein EZS27_022946 [termite gut metagenome]|uniref:Uncharacterized protein n=1 Tax=termite gut metagenome TaxID=433724 RepID=A0A5J4R341_9ZZZZ
MKKIFYLPTLVAILFSFSNCGNEDPAEMINIDKMFTTKASIEGYAYLNVSKSSTEVLQYAPEGTVLSFTISNESLLGNGFQGNYVATATVEGNGRYSVSLPTRTDGISVPVSINGSQLYFTITQGDGSEEDVLFEVTSTSQIIETGFTYQKNVKYEKKEVLSSKQIEGVYKATLKYHNGVELLNVPAKTKVEITILKNDLSATDIFFIKEVGNNGALEFKYSAPSVLTGGVAFSLNSVFVGNKITNATDMKISVAYYTLSLNDKIYGGITIDKGVQTYTLSNIQVGN